MNILYGAMYKTHFMLVVYFPIFYKLCATKLNDKLPQRSKDHCVVFSNLIN